MQSYAALLRGINVGGKKKVAMGELRDLAGSLGLVDARTLLQSGNLVFRSAVKSAAALEALLEKETLKQLGVETRYLVRSAADFQKAIAGNPFLAEAKSDPSHMLVLFCREAPTPAAVKALQEKVVGRERIRSAGREAYAVYPDGIGESKLTITIIERGLGTTCTARNWNTVMKIGAALE